MGEIEPQCNENTQTEIKPFIVLNKVSLFS